jgi:hypothetical protein
MSEALRSPIPSVEAKSTLTDSTSSGNAYIDPWVCNIKTVTLTNHEVPYPSLGIYSTSTLNDLIGTHHPINMLFYAVILTLFSPAFAPLAYALAIPHTHFNGADEAHGQLIPRGRYAAGTCSFHLEQID